MRQLEQTVDREMRILGRLPSESLSADSARRIRAAVSAEAAGVRRRAHWRRARRWPTIAAAAVLALWSLRTGPVPPVSDDERLFQSWARAFERVGRPLVSLISDDGLREFDAEIRLENQLDQLIRSIEGATDLGA